MFSLLSDLEQGIDVCDIGREDEHLELDILLRPERRLAPAIERRLAQRRRQQEFLALVGDGLEFRGRPSDQAAAKEGKGEDS